MYIYILNGEKEGERFNLKPGVYLMGRSADTEIVIPGDRYVSGKHAALECAEDGTISLSDKKSRNGTFLLGEPVTKPAKVNPGDIFRVGHTFFKLSKRADDRVLGDDAPMESTPEAIMVIDLVGSSNLVQAVGDRLASKVKNTLQFHLNENLKKNPAKFVKGTGDGFLITFSKVKPAVMLAVGFLQDLKQNKSFSSVKIRIGINYGETFTLPDGDRRGMAVDQTFRVESAKVDDMHQTVLGIKKDEMPRSDRIFTTEVVYKMIAKDPKIKTRCVGFFDLKGFTGRHKLFEVII